MDIGNRIKELRIEKKLSQTELAKEIQIARNTLSQFENNKAKPSLEVLIKISKYFHVTTDFLLGLTDY